MTAAALLFALGALPTLIAWSFAYAVLPRRRLARIGLVLAAAAGVVALFWPLSLLFSLALVAGVLPVLLALEWAVMARRA